ncbi:MAG TPA: hypothetical protein VHN98_08250 [Acidimicrobiales bacterium]|nr:hypothetical protein [Acidimicrobiales bacterium]
MPRPPAAGEVTTIGVEPRAPARASGPLESAGDAAAVAMGALWLVLLALILRPRIFVSNDSVSNYVHVWWIAERLWHGHGLPIRFPALASGRALAYPYGFVPWTFAALLWPLLGDRATTLMLVVGAVAMLGSTFFAFPEVRRGWRAATVLANPLAVAAIVLGQGPFLWGVSFLLLAVAAWRRRRPGLAAVLAGIGALTHAAVVLPLLLMLCALGWVLSDGDDRPALVRAAAVACLIAAPGVVAVAASPVMAQTDTPTKVVELAGTLAERLVVIAVPLLLIAMGRLRSRAWAPAAFVVILLANPVLGPYFGMHYGWLALRRTPNTALVPFIRSSEFVPGATYRILRAADGKIGMYQLVRNGAVIDSELFPESIHRKSYRTAEEYSTFLRDRRVDYVLAFHNYDEFWHTNEHALLERLASANGCTPTTVGVVLIHRDARFDGYRIARRCAPGG